jgi:hypothetical protein
MYAPELGTVAAQVGQDGIGVLHERHHEALLDLVVLGAA